MEPASIDILRSLKIIGRGEVEGWSQRALSGRHKNHKHTKNRSTTTVFAHCKGCQRAVSINGSNKSVPMTVPLY